MVEPTLEALKQFLIENSCKVKTSDAIEFYRTTYADKAADHSKFLELTFPVVLASSVVVVVGTLVCYVCPDFA